MNEVTAKRLMANPHYKPTKKEEEEMKKYMPKVKTFGVIPKHPTEPEVVTHKQPIDNQKKGVL